MLTRRLIMLFALLLPALPARADDASAFVERISAQLIAVVNSNLPPAEKQKRLRPIIDSAVDVDEVARFCLGRFWRTASPEQQKTYIGLFHEVLVTSITTKLGDYQGVKVTVGPSRPRDDASVVTSTVERPNNPPSKVDWLISTASGSPKIVDVIAEGTSLRLTQRSDYAAFVTRNSNSVDALIAAMKQQVAQQGG